MEAPQKHSFGKIAQNLTYLLIGTAMLASIVGFFFISQMESISSPLAASMPRDLYNLNQSVHLNSLAQVIRYYDEVLTQSARNYAFTGDKAWKERYLAAEPELDTAIRGAIAEGDDTDRGFFSSVDAANIKLVAMEHEALGLVDQGNASGAIGILGSSAYAQQKAIYARGLQGYLIRQSGKYDEAASTSASTLADALDNARAQTARMKQMSLLFLVSFLLLIAVAGYFASKMISEPLFQLYNATKELERGNYGVRVNISTGDEFEQLGSALNMAAESLGRMDEERKQVEKAKTQFLSITSHELRSPMTPMKAQLQMLQAGYLGKLNRKQKESLAIILRNAERLDRILVDFLEISRIETARLKFEFRKTDLAKTAREVAAYMKGYMPEKKVRVSAKIGHLPIIEADADRVSQVLRNLVGNAIKFSPDRSMVVVKARVQGSFIEFSVKDRGTGISQENQKQLFEPFFQVDKTFSRSQQGTGLGLAISRGIVESQGGKIWLESVEGRGTTFLFTVPFTPVREIKPIRVLFSDKKEAEERLKLTFKEFLGPLGETEFERLREQSGISRESVMAYIDDLHAQCIIPDAEEKQFRKALPEGI